MSFEPFVRPFVDRPIGPPAPALPVSPEDTPEQGVAVLGGSGGKFTDLSYSESSSWSKDKKKEKKRVVDRERIYQKEPGPGKQVNKENYVDVERVKKLSMQKADGTTEDFTFATPDYQAPDRYNIEVLEKDVTIINANAPPEPEGDIEEGGGGPP